MTVFDNGGFHGRVKDSRKKFDWLEGFNAGYGAAIERYITLERKGKKDKE